MLDDQPVSEPRFRYVGLTTAVAQTIDDQPGTVIRNFGTGWGGERLVDWTGSGSNLRFYGDFDSLPCSRLVEETQLLARCQELHQLGDVKRQRAQSLG